MTPQAFTEQLVRAYQLAREPSHRHDKLRRGESRSVASEVEDLLAFYLVENLPSIDRVRINQPMSAFINKRRKTLKPDLLIIRDGEVRAFVDLKMDLGYKRDAIAATFLTASKHLKAMRGGSVTFWETKRAAGGVQESVAVATNAAYIFVVVTEKNATGSAYAKVEAAAKRLPLLALHTLVREVHPNDYGLSETELIALCSPQIARSLPALQACVSNAVA